MCPEPTSSQKNTHLETGKHCTSTQTLIFSDSTFLNWKYTYVQHKQIHLLEAKVSHT